MVSPRSDELIWHEYDTDSIESLEQIMFERNPNSMIFSGECEAWGYIARAVLPQKLHKPGALRVRARMNIKKGTVALAVLTPDETGCYTQAMVTAPGPHVIAIEADCTAGPGPIILRHGEAVRGETEFELEVIGSSG